MAVRRYSEQALREALASPGPAGRLGLRVVSCKADQGRESLHYLAPADYQCSRLIAQLADEWVEYVEAAEITRGPAMTYSRAIDRLGKFVDAAPESAAGAERLTLESGDLVHLVARWERELPETYAAGSKWPAFLANALRLLIVRRDDHADRGVDAGLARFARGRTLVAQGESTERDEFTLAEKRAMVRAAWAGVIALEKRLAEAWALAEQGRHPDRGSWLSVPDLLWGISRGAIQLRDINAALPPWRDWPAALRSMVEEDGAPIYHRTAKLRLTRKLVARLYPTTSDLHAFRVLLVDATGHASEEVTSFGEDDVEFLPKGVRLTLVKNRAGLLRHRAFRDAPAPSRGAENNDHDAYDILDEPRRETSAVVRRLLTATARVRAKTPHITDTLFVRAWVTSDQQLAFDRWRPAGARDSFAGWLAEAGVDVAGEKHIGRLRKSTKVEKAIASGGRISAAADDHLEETFAGHYAQGTTLRVLSGQVIATAQEHWFRKAVEGPTVVTSDGQGHSTTPPWCSRWAWRRGRPRASSRASLTWVSRIARTPTTRRSARRALSARWHRCGAWNAETPGSCPVSSLNSCCSPSIWKE